MIKWKNGEMSVEEVKDVEEKVSSASIHTNPVQNIQQYISADHS
jgi:hypothetical protein